MSFDLAAHQSLLIYNLPSSLLISNVPSWCYDPVEEVLTKGKYFSVHYLDSPKGDKTERFAQILFQKWECQVFYESEMETNKLPKLAKQPLPELGLEFWSQEEKQQFDKVISIQKNLLPGLIENLKKTTVGKSFRTITIDSRQSRINSMSIVDAVKYDAIYLFD
jgi:hypothetical protein